MEETNVHVVICNLNRSLSNSSSSILIGTPSSSCFLFNDDISVWSSPLISPWMKFSKYVIKSGEGGEAVMKYMWGKAGYTGD